MRFPALLTLLILCTACFSGFGFDQPEVTLLAPHPLSIVLPAGFEGANSGGRLVLTNPEDARVVSVFAAGPGVAASTRDIAEVLPGATYTTDWLRPHTFDGMSGIEARVVEAAPLARTHWIAILDAPSGVVFIDVAIDADVSTSPSGDDLWNAARDSIRRAL
jgi:hypothetical protein